jgi:hypothetical protein
MALPGFLPTQLLSGYRNHTALQTEKLNHRKKNQAFSGWLEPRASFKVENGFRRMADSLGE